jgi:hypothetical protein
MTSPMLRLFAAPSALVAIRAHHPACQFVFCCAFSGPPRLVRCHRTAAKVNQLTAVTLPLGWRTAPGHAGTAVWNENPGSQISQLCGNKCEAPTYPAAESGRSPNFSRPSLDANVAVTCEPDILKLPAAFLRHSHSYRQFLNLAAIGSR